jgi:hypothetical protein
MHVPQRTEHCERLSLDVEHKSETPSKFPKSLQTGKSLHNAAVLVWCLFFVVAWRLVLTVTKVSLSSIAVSACAVLVGATVEIS